MPRCNNIIQFNGKYDLKYLVFCPLTRKYPWCWLFDGLPFGRSQCFCWFALLSHQTASNSFPLIWTHQLSSQSSLPELPISLWPYDYRLSAPLPCRTPFSKDLVNLKSLAWSSHWPLALTKQLPLTTLLDTFPKLLGFHWNPPFYLDILLFPSSCRLTIWTPHYGIISWSLKFPLRSSGVPTQFRAYYPRSFSLRTLPFPPCHCYAPHSGTWNFSRAVEVDPRISLSEYSWAWIHLWILNQRASCWTKSHFLGLQVLLLIPSESRWVVSGVIQRWNSFKSLLSYSLVRINRPFARFVSIDRIWNSQITARVSEFNHCLNCKLP